MIVRMDFHPDDLLLPQQPDILHGVGADRIQHDITAELARIFQRIDQLGIALAGLIHERARGRDPKLVNLRLVEVTVELLGVGRPERRLIDAAEMAVHVDDHVLDLQNVQLAAKA